MNRPVLQGGTRRRPGRRRRRGVVWLTIALLVLSAAGGIYVLQGSGGGGGKKPSGGDAAAKSPQAEVKTPTRPSTEVPTGLSLTGPNAFNVRFHGGKPRAALVFDMKSGRVLYKRNPTMRLPIASLTKIMTALIAVDRTKPDEKVRIAHDAFDYSGSGVGVLPKRKAVPVKGLMAGLLLPSGNDAAIALADHIAGDQKRFVAIMNRRAQALGLRCTHYSSPHGLETSNRSCASDLAVLARLAMRQPRIATIVSHEQLATRFPIKGGKLYVNSTNPLLHLNYKGTIGLKTGSTDKAGHCFVGVVRRGRRELAVVLLHSPDTGSQARQLLNAAFKAGRA